MNFKTAISREVNNENVSDASPKHLGIELGKNYLSATILNLKNNEYVFIQTYFFEESINAAFDYITKNESVFQQKFKTVELYLNSAHSAIIPGAIFEKEKAENYLKLGDENIADKDVLLDQLSFDNALNVFGIEKKLHATILNKFPNCQIHHSSSAFIENCIIKSLESDVRVFLNINDLHIELCYISENKLQFFNQFEYSNTDDILYYTLSLYNQFKLDNNQQKLIYSSTISVTDNIEAELKKYIANIEAQNRSSNFEYAENIKAAPVNFCYNLINAYQCEL